MAASAYRPAAAMTGAPGANSTISFPSSPRTAMQEQGQERPQTPPSSQPAQVWTSPRKAPQPPSMTLPASKSTWKWKRPGEFSAAAAAAASASAAPATAPTPAPASDILATAPKTAAGAPQLPDFPFIQPRDESMGCLAARRREKGKAKQQDEDATPSIVTPRSLHRQTPSASSSIDPMSLWTQTSTQTQSHTSTSRRPRIPATYQHQAPNSPRLDATRHPSLATAGASASTSQPRQTPTHSRFLSEGAAGHNRANRPPLPPPLIPAKEDEMDVVMAAGNHSRGRNRSVGNLLDMQGEETRSNATSPLTLRSRTPPSSMGDHARPVLPPSLAAGDPRNPTLYVADNYQPPTPRTPRTPRTPQTPVSASASAPSPPPKSSPKSWRSVPNFRFGNSAINTPRHISPAMPSLTSFTGQDAIGDSPVHPQRRTPLTQRTRTWSRSRKQPHAHSQSAVDVAPVADDQSHTRSQSHSMDLLSNQRRSQDTPMPTLPPRNQRVSFTSVASSQDHDVTCTPVAAKQGLKSLWDATKSRLHTSKSQPSLASIQPRTEHSNRSSDTVKGATTSSSLPQQPQQRPLVSPSSPSLPIVAPTASDYGRKRNKSLKGRLQPSSNKRDTYVFRPDADESTLPPRTVYRTDPSQAILHQVLRRRDGAWTPVAILRNQNGNGSTSGAGSAQEQRSENDGEDDDGARSSLSGERETWQVNTTSANNSPYIRTLPWRPEESHAIAGSPRSNDGDGFLEAVDVGGVPSEAYSPTMTRSDSDLRSQYATRRESLNLGELLAAHRMKRESSSYAQDVGRWQDMGGFDLSRDASTTDTEDGGRLRRISFAPSATSSNARGEGDSSFYYTADSKDNGMTPQPSFDASILPAPASNGTSSGATSRHTSATSGLSSSAYSTDNDVMWENSRPSSEFFSSSSVRRLHMSSTGGDAVPMMPVTPRSNVLSLTASSRRESASEEPLPAESFLPSMESSSTVQGDASREEDGKSTQQGPFTFPRPPHGSGAVASDGEVTPTSKVTQMTEDVGGASGGAAPRVGTLHRHRHQRSNASISSQSSVGTTGTRFGFPSMSEGGGGGGSVDQLHQRRSTQSTPSTPSTSSAPSSAARPPSANGWSTTGKTAALRTHKTSASASSLGSLGSSSRYMNGPSWTAGARGGEAQTSRHSVGSSVMMLGPSSSMSSSASSQQKHTQSGESSGTVTPTGVQQRAPHHPYAYVYEPAAAEETTAGVQAEPAPPSSEDTSKALPPLPHYQGHRRLKNSIDLLEKAAMGTIEESRRVGGSTDIVNPPDVGQFEDAPER